MRKVLEILKKVILRDKVWFPIFKNTFLYSAWHRSNGIIAKVIYGNPSAQMFVIGVTWTDGKTTTANLIHHIIQSNLGNCILISTANIKFWTQEIFNDSKMTSLNVFQLNRLLSDAKNQGINYAVVEVSSHWLAQYRFEWVSFSCAVLTNISSEHLDFHKDINEYANTKKKLFANVLRNSLSTKYAVLPKDDDYGRKWMDEMIFDKMIDYGINLSSTIRWEQIEEKINSTNYDLIYLGKKYPIKSLLPAKFNVYNQLAAISVWIELGIDLGKITSSIEKFKPVNGRVNIYEDNQITYIVDFGHTPKALESLLNYVNNIKKDNNWKIITLFGAPGKRDKYKRPLMWEVVDKWSDVVIVTEDDSMSENTISIINDIIKGINRKEGDNFFIQPTREFALKFAISIANPRDIVVLAGKWHERKLYTNHGAIEWNDMNKLKEFLEEKKKEGIK